jgi:hypothetical protein
MEKNSSKVFVQLEIVKRVPFDMETIRKSEVMFEHMMHEFILRSV